MQSHFLTITVSHHHPLLSAAWIVSSFWTQKKFARKLLPSFFFPLKTRSLCVCVWHLGILRRQTQLISFVKSFSTRSSSSSFSFPPHNSEILIFWVVRYPLRVSIYLNTKRKARSGSLTELYKQPSLSHSITYWPIYMVTSFLFFLCVWRWEEKLRCFLFSRFCRRVSSF